MRGWEKSIAETLEQPDVILNDSDYDNREVYYRYESKKKRYIKVVIEKTPNSNIVNVKTAHPSDSVKQGENKIIWMPSKS